MSNLDLLFNGVTNAGEAIKDIFKGTAIAFVKEAKEIKDITPTDRQKDASKVMAKGAMLALAGMGIPTTKSTEDVVAKAIAYGLADLKNAREDKSKFLAQRVIEEIKTQRKD